MESFYAVHVPSPDSKATSSGGVFKSLVEASKFASSPEAKGARFKRFHSATEAKQFVDAGEVSSPRSKPDVSNEILIASSSSVQEPSVSYPSLSPVQLTQFKKTIENMDHWAFVQMMVDNPRYVINTSSDTPTILVEGFRYNALHVAARAGNAFVTRMILRFISNRAALAKLYNTNEEDAMMRSNALQISFLNTPDKRAFNTPLHFASMFGYKAVVGALVAERVCDKTLKNGEQKTAHEVCCTRFKGEKCMMKATQDCILELFCSFYVPFYRPTDGYSTAVIHRPGPFPPTALPDPDRSKAVLNEYLLAAVAGPFHSAEQAEIFYNSWKKEERVTRLRDPLKGVERVGRRLAAEQRVRWSEYWSFAKALVELNSTEGLTALEEYLCRIRLGEKDKENNGDEEAAMFEDAVEELSSYKENPREKERSPEPSDPAQKSMLDIVDEKKSSSAEGNVPVSEGSAAVAENGVAANVTDDQAHEGEGKLENCSGKPPAGVPESSDVENEDFYTPPSSPEPVYITDTLPTKDDADLVTALMQIDPEELEGYPSVCEYIRSMHKVPVPERAAWPTTDSPRAKNRRRTHVKRIIT